jgi:VWFA-related protein
MTRLLPAALLLLCAPGIGAQQSFRTGVNLVEVDVVVSARDGRPVRGLTKDDFEVFEDGNPVETATFTAVDLPAAPPGEALPPADRSGSSVSTNDQPEDGRVVLIVMDDYHVSFDAGRFAAAKATARRLVERLGPYDQAAVITSSGQRSAQAEFTADKARLVEAIDKFFPQAELRATGIAGASSARGTPAGPFSFVAEIKARWAMDTLSTAARALALIPHRRKAVLLVSQGLPITLEEAITNPNAGGAFQALRDFIVTAQRSNIAVYPIDPCGLDLDQGCSTASRDNLRSIAEGTGGFAVTNTNAPESRVDRMVEESGSYYLIGYYSPAPPDDGKRHRIRVRTRVPDVQVRARDGYVAARPRAASAPAAPLDALIGAPIQTRGLPLRLVAIPAPLAKSPGATIVVGVEFPAALAVEAGRIDVAVAAIDQSGRTRAQLRFTNTFTATAPAASGWTRTATRLDVPPGTYQVRFAAVAASGTQGSVFTDVTVPKFDAPISAGGLSLGVPASLAAAGAERLAGVLPLLPVATREIARDESLDVQLPIRVAARRASGRVEAVVRLAGPDGAVQTLGSVTRPAQDFASGAGDVLRVPLPRPLAPGQYRLTVDATIGSARVTRELAFTVSEGARSG